MRFAQVRAEHPVLQSAPLVAVDRKRVEERLSRRLLPHVEQQLDHLRGGHAVLARQSRAVDLVEVFQAHVLGQEVPDGFGGRVGRALALHLPSQRPEDHLGIEVLASLVAGADRRREVALEARELLIALRVLDQLRGFLDLAGDDDPGRAQGFLQDAAEVRGGSLTATQDEPRPPTSPRRVTVLLPAARVKPKVLRPGLGRACASG